MSYERHRPWILRTALGLAYLMALTPTFPALAADAPDEAPPVPPPAEEAPLPPPPPLLDDPIPVDPAVEPAPPVQPGVPGVNGIPVPPVDAGPAPFLGAERELIFFSFETEDTATGVPNEVVSTLPSRIATLLNRNYGMNASVFYRTSPIVQRAVRERRLTETQTGSPQVADYPIIAREYGTDKAVTGTVSTYMYDRAASTVEIGVTLDVRDLAQGGRTRVISVSGQSTPVAVVSSEIALATEAANDAAAKAAAEIAALYGATATPVLITPAQAPRARKNRSSTLLAVGALLLLVAIVAGNRGGGGDDNNNGGGTLPPPNGGNGGNTPPPPPF